MSSIPAMYLGDGVYATFDGYHIRLSLRDHRNEPVVALEPQVLHALILFADQNKMLPKEFTYTPL